jgi:cytochrome c oxidase cbb3-type subunit 3
MKTRITILSILSMLGTSAFAQDAAAQGGFSDPLLWVIYIVVGLLLVVTYLLYLVTKQLKKYAKGQFETEEQKMYDSRNFWEKIFQVKPVGTDKDTIIDEAHDGIYELDNPPPPWFMFLFYGTILFAVIYFVRFSVTGSAPTQAEEYVAEMQAAEADKEEALAEEGQSVDETTVVALTEPSEIEAGKKIYTQNCKVCHGDGGKGMEGNGPNLTDEYWKHGGGAKNIFKTIKYGVVEKGMLAWDGNLTPKMMQQVTSFIISLEGSNPEGAKAPEGEKWVPQEEPAAEEAADATTEEATTAETEVTEEVESGS